MVGVRRDGLGAPAVLDSSCLPPHGLAVRAPREERVQWPEIQVNNQGLTPRAPGLPAGEAGDGPCAAVVQCSLQHHGTRRLPHPHGHEVLPKRVRPCPALHGPLGLLSARPAPPTQASSGPSLDVCQSRVPRAALAQRKYDCLINGEWWGGVNLSPAAPPCRNRDFHSCSVMHLNFEQVLPLYQTGEKMELNFQGVPLSCSPGDAPV